MTLSELTKALEAAVDEVSVKRSASEAADRAAADAKAAYNKSVQSVHSLHGEYQKIMNDILSFGGTVHIAK